MDDQLNWRVTKLIDKKCVPHLTYYTILFIIAIVAAIGADCPTNCDCRLKESPKLINCAGQSLRKFPINIIADIEYLDLSGNLMLKVPNEINSFKNLRMLNLSDNRLTYLPKNLSNLHNLLNLDLSRNKIDNMSTISAIKQLSQLKHLNLSKNRISNIGELKSNSLENAHLDDCDITEIAVTSFTGLPRLMTLSMSRNPLEIFDKPVSFTLTHLDLSGCNLQRLKPDTFQSMPKLYQLTLKNNSKLVYSYGKSTLRHENLKRLDVSECNLDRPGLHGFPQLTYAKLSKNSIQSLPNGVFSRNRALQSLYLDVNIIEQVYEKTFTHLVNLQILDLSTNSIEKIHWTTFREHINLKLLNLSNNNMEKMNNLKTFAEIVDLSGNMLFHFGHDLLNFERIRTLNLSNNILETFPINLRSSTLEVLNIRNNKLKVMDNSTLASLPQLTYLDISENELSKPPTVPTFRNNKHLKYVNLENNQWNCQCRELHNLYQYLSYLPEAPTAKLLCTSPKNASGYTWKSTCSSKWEEIRELQQNRTWGLVLLALLTIIVLFCGIISVQRTIKLKMLARNQRQRAEANEVQNRLRRLQRRNQDSELNPYSSGQVTHCRELEGPPSYEEAINMARMAHSLDTLNRLNSENAISTQVLGSEDNFRIRKKHSRRIRKRVMSEDCLTQRQMRREERIRQKTKKKEKCAIFDVRIGDNECSSESESEVITSVAAKTENVARCTSECVNTSSNENENNPSTSSSRKKRLSRLPLISGTLTDDEDSDTEIIDEMRLENVTVVAGNLRLSSYNGR